MPKWELPAGPVRHFVVPSTELEPTWRALRA
jgi:hypothetical protein